MNGILVLNLRDFLPAMARRAMLDAARRWRVEYVEITEPLAAIHHFWQKTLIPRSRHARPFRRILVLDADLLVGDDCPSPFEAVPPTDFGVVGRRQPHHRPPYVGPGEARHFGLQPYPDEGRHLTGGFVLYDPNYHALYLDRWRQAGAFCRWRKAGNSDQGALSCVLHQFSAPVTWLPWQYNAVHATRLQEPAYVYHFNMPRGQPLRRQMEDCPWRNAKQFR
jgi:hypothetical protein